MWDGNRALPNRWAAPMGLSENQCGMETRYTGTVLRPYTWLSENQCGMETRGCYKAAKGGRCLLSENQCGMETEATRDEVM